jgi:hypothetical protein
VLYSKFGCSTSELGDWETLPPLATMSDVLLKADVSSRDFIGTSLRPNAVKISVQACTFRRDR